VRRKSILVVFIMITVSGNFTPADGPLVEWEKTFGGSWNDVGSDVQQTSSSV